MDLRYRFIHDLFIFTVPSLWFFLFLPIELYYRNKNEWGVPVSEFLVYGFSLALLAAALLAFISSRLSGKKGIIFKAALYVAFSIALFHTFLPFAAEEKELDGILLNFDFSLRIQLLSFSAMLVSGLMIYGVRQKLFSHYSNNYLWVSSVILLSSLALAWSSRSAGEAITDQAAGRLNPPQLRELYTFSSRQNLLLLILDAVPADVALEVIHTQETIAPALQDFIFFKNNLSISPQTHMSMSNLHVGSFLSESFDEHLQSWLPKVRSKSFFNRLSAAGWKLAMIGRGPCPEKLEICGFTSTQNLGFGRRFSLSEQFIHAMNLVLLKTSPIFLKKWVYNEEDFLLKSVDVFRGTVSHDSSAPAVQIPRFASEAQRDNYFLTFLANHGLVGDETPRFKMFHLMSAHPRFYLDANCKKGEQEYSRGMMKNHVKCQFEAIAHLVKKLREKGIYHTTTIVVAGDHGIDFPSAFVGSGQSSHHIPQFQQVVTQANALLMLKRENADFPYMQVSELPTSTADIAMTICDISHIDCRGQFKDSWSLLRLETLAREKSRVRLYAHHGFGAENAKQGMSLYAVQGVLWHEENWRYVAPLPGAGKGSGESAREALRTIWNAENGGPAQERRE